MKIVYRMRGLLGDATEDMVDNLESDKGRPHKQKIFMFLDISISQYYVAYRAATETTNNKYFMFLDISIGQ